MKKHFTYTLMAVVVVLGAGRSAGGGLEWQTVLTEDFDSDPSGNWSYTGRQNGGSQDLIRWNSAEGNLSVEWDQSNHYQDYEGGTPLDPYQIEPSRYTRCLGVELTDADTFKLASTVRISSLADTTEFYQVANFGLYNPGETGPDRTMSDNWSGNTNIVKDSCDFVEFNYFIQNDSTWEWYPMTQCTIGAHIDGLSADLTVGSGGDALFHDTDMGADNWLPTGTDLFVEVTYDSTSRRAYSAIYTDAEHSAILSVNGAEQYYWTVPLPGDKHFTLTDAGFWNYVGANWGGTNGSGTGSFDDLYVMHLVPEPASMLVFVPAMIAACLNRRRYTQTNNVSRQ